MCQQMGHADVWTSIKGSHSASETRQGCSTPDQARGHPLCMAQLLQGGTSTACMAWHSSRARDRWKRRCRASAIDSAHRNAVSQSRLAPLRLQRRSCMLRPGMSHCKCSLQLLQLWCAGKQACKRQSTLLRMPHQIAQRVSQRDLLCSDFRLRLLHQRVCHAVPDAPQL